MLDSYIRATAENENSVNYLIEIDFDGISDQNSIRQMPVIYDLLEFRSKSNTKELCNFKGNAISSSHNEALEGRVNLICLIVKLRPWSCPGSGNFLVQELFQNSELML